MAYHLRPGAEYGALLPVSPLLARFHISAGAACYRVCSAFPLCHLCGPVQPRHRVHASAGFCRDAHAAGFVAEQGTAAGALADCEPAECWYIDCTSADRRSPGSENWLASCSAFEGCLSPLSYYQW